MRKKQAGKRHYQHFTNCTKKVFTGTQKVFKKSKKTLKCGTLLQKAPFWDFRGGSDKLFGILTLVFRQGEILGILQLKCQEIKF